ncbi:MAG TPA: histidinol dehydrogenase [Rickettsiales bacterium]|nr:histidinol dehydrogenase [Rickettsiales bacterium]
MVNKLNTAGDGFDEAFRKFLDLRETTERDVSAIVRDIIEKVRSEGDNALIQYTQQFDRFKPSTATIRISAAEIRDARAKCGNSIISALEHAAQRIRSYHEKQLPPNLEYTDAEGVRLGWRWNAIDAVGLYVPGGTASYPSSVLMNAVPAITAGVKRLVMVVPTPDGAINPAVLAAASIAGIQEIYRIGGAQAVAALAYGTKTIAPVDKIVGPGNAYVAEAKRQVFGKVGIDMIAGPSEILVVADNQNKPEWIAADLLSQAEHDRMAQSVLITDDAAFASAVEKAVESALFLLPRAEIARASWEQYGAIIIAKDLVQDAARIVDAIAPEHLELAVENPDALAKLIRHAGAIFLGRHTPEAVGDYVAGPSHVLPTSGTARFSSGLSVYDFLKRTSLIGCDATSVKKIGADAALLADTEGLPAHALSVTLRL